MKLKLSLIAILLAGSLFSLSAQSELTVPRLRISASGGVGYLFAEGQETIGGVVSMEKVDKLNNDLRRATHLNADIHYLLKVGFGVGVKYIFQNTSGEASEIVIDPYDGIHYIVIDMGEEDYIHFTGLSIGTFSAVGNNQNLYLTSSLSAGYAWLRSELSMLGQNRLITGSNFAMNADIGADYRFHPRLGIGVVLGSFLGYFDQITITDGISSQEQKLDKNSRYNASSIHLSLGLRYYINR